MLTEYELEVGWANRAEVGGLLQCMSLWERPHNGPDSPGHRFAVILRNCVYELGAMSVIGPASDYWWIYPLIGVAKFYGCRFELEIDDSDTYTLTIAAGEDPLDPDTGWVAPDKELFEDLVGFVEVPDGAGEARSVLAYFEYIAS